MNDDSQIAAAPAAAANADKDAVASLAGQVRHADTGTLARLRRFHPHVEGQRALFETEWMLHAARIHPANDQQRERWALVLHCLAIARGLHDGRIEFEPGRVLARLRVSEARVRQLLESDDHVLSDLLPRLARRLAAAGAAVNWRPLAELALHTGTPQEERANQARRRIVSHYLQAQAQAGDGLGAEAHDT